MNRVPQRAHESKSSVKYVTITDDNAGQRIDNWLIGQLKSVPKAHIYRILRKGEVRVNKKRITASYRLNNGDLLRIPPLYLEKKAGLAKPCPQTVQLLTDRILYEDDNLLILNKPSGMSVHVGSTVRMGIIEALRHAYPKLANLELAHRLDTETSGCLVLAKKKRILRELHALLREGSIVKKYWALTKGQWKSEELVVEKPLFKDYHDGGKHVVSVSSRGKQARSVFKPIKSFKHASLVEVTLFTGRTHQIRVHAQYQGHPIACDDRYGDTDFNQLFHGLGLKRLFLHARSLDFTLPSLNQRITVVAPLDPELERCMRLIEHDEMR